MDIRERKSQRHAPLEGSEAKKLSDAAHKTEENVGIKSQTGVLCYCVCFSTFLVFACLLGMAVVPYPIQAVSFRLPSPRNFTGALQSNRILTSTEHLFKFNITGPESLVIDEVTGEIYTGTYNGEVVRIKGDKMEVIARFGKPPCGSLHLEPTCGRPLGIRFDKNGQLLVMDAYLGMHRVDPRTGRFQVLLSSKNKIDDHHPKFFNDFDVNSEGIFYISDSSTKWYRKDLHLMLMESGHDGRVIQYDPATSKSSILVGNLSFPNGVQLSPDEDFLIFAETSRARLMKYHLKGDNKGKLEVFVDNLPGFPDNIRPSRSGGYWVGFALVRHPEWISPIDLMGPYPFVRNIISKLLSFDMFFHFARKWSYGLVVELDSNAQIVRSLHDPRGEILPSVSEVLEAKGHLYFGSYHLPFLGCLKLK